MSRYVFLLGAGASASEGAPLQRDLIKSYFATRRGMSHPEIEEEVAEFFDRVFGVDVTKLDDTVDLPTFEEVLGIIDLAALRGEALRGIPASEDDGSTVTLSSARRGLILLMADAVRRGVSHHPRLHAEFVQNLRESDKITDTTFVTTNYDTLLDNAIYDRSLPPEDQGPGSPVDYGFGGLVPNVPIPEPEERSISLSKIHGSLNWLHCSVCADLVVTHGPDIVTRLLENPETARCTHCEALREPVIIPPTLYKSFNNLYLAAAWHRATRVLRDCSVLFICGYSMPDADMHVKYLVKSAQMNRGTSTDALRIVLVNNHKEKASTNVNEELSRYSRLFGKDAVMDSRLSFEQVSLDPGSVFEFANA